MFEKVYRDNDVAVLVSPGFGAGWFTWNEEYPECLFDPDIVTWILNGNNKEFNSDRDTLPFDFEEKFGRGFYAGGFHQLEVEWVPKDSKFIVREYDGAEYIELMDEVNWITA